MAGFCPNPPPRYECLLFRVRAPPRRRCLRQASGLCFVEQLEPVTAGAIVYDAGLCTEGRKLLKRRRATVKTLSLRLLLDPVQFLLMERQNLNLPQEKPSFFSNIFPLR